MATVDVASVARLGDDEVAELADWHKLSALSRGEIDPVVPSDVVTPRPAIAQPSTVARDARTSPPSPTAADDDGERKKLERAAIAEIRTLVQKSTKARDDETWYAKVNPLTERKEIKWSTLIPLLVVLVIALYGALRLYASPGTSQPRAATRASGSAPALNREAGEGALPEESLFTPRTQYSVPGLEQRDEPDLAAPVPVPEARPPAASPSPKPAAPASWQAGLTLALPAEPDDEEYPVSENEGEHVALVEGTRIPAVLTGTIASSFESPVQARLDEDLIDADRIALPRGTLLLGTSQTNITQRRIYVRFHRAILPSGESFELHGAAQNSDFSTGLTADRVEKHRRSNVVASALGGIASRAGGLVGIRAPGAVEAGAAARAVQGQVQNEVRGAMGDVTLFVHAGRRVFVYLESDVEY
jgi:type IV secretory pathway VirB10-like protein